MTLEQLIKEGRGLARPCVFLRDTGPGPLAAVWHPKPTRNATAYPDEVLWLTLDLQQVPGLPAPPADARFLSVFTDEVKGEAGRVAFVPGLPASGIALYATPALPLPPINAVFARGSDTIGAWLAEHDWPRNERYNPNFGDRVLVDEYERQWQAECPAFSDTSVYAVLGGWHLPGADDDWHERTTTPLTLWTLRDAEPWVEVFYEVANRYSVLQRVT